VDGCAVEPNGSAIEARKIGATSNHHWYARKPFTSTLSSSTAIRSMSRATNR
jgi:hypothetical protein